MFMEIRFTPFQEYVLKACYKRKSQKMKKADLFDYFKIQDKKSKSYEAAHGRIIKTIDSLIKKGYLVGFGFRTQKEWHYREIKLTLIGKRKAKSLFGVRKLPL